MALKKIAGLSELCFRFNFKVGDVRTLLSNGRALLFSSFLPVCCGRTRVFENQFTYENQSPSPWHPFYKKASCSEAKTGMFFKWIWLLAMKVKTYLCLYIHRHTCTYLYMWKILTIHLTLYGHMCFFFFQSILLQDLTFLFFNTIFEM